MDQDRGVCNVFNPCYGFPVGDDCKTDADCDNHLNLDALSDQAINLPPNAKITGGVCNGFTKVCECKACVAGKDCKLAKQAKGGKGRGVRFTLMTAVAVSSAITSAQSSEWSPGVWIHLHTHYDKGSLNKGFVAGPGTVLEAVIGKDKNHEFRGYPFTNCSNSFNIDPSQCELNCLRRVQTLECCKTADGEPPKMPAIVKGKFENATTYTLPSGRIKVMPNPTMAYDCRMHDSGVKACMETQATRFNDGEICLPGSLGAADMYTFLFFKNNKPNSYADDTHDNLGGISDAEEKSNDMVKHCVWRQDQLTNGIEALLGRSCKNDDDCTTSLGEVGEPGKCQKAYRAYCPMRCTTDHFHILRSTSNPMSKGTEELLALRELSTTTEQQKITGASTTLKKFKPSCEVDDDGNVIEDTPECFTLEEATKFVQDNYAIVNFDYADFVEPNYVKQEAISIATVVGTIGGNLGLFMGFSIMTILEWCEMVIFFALGSVCVLTGGRLNLLPFCVRPKLSDAPEDQEDPHLCIPEEQQGPSVKAYVVTKNA